MIEIKPASTVGGNIKKRISEIFIDGFGKHFTFFSKDTNKLVQAFEHMFQTDLFYVALFDGKVVGITALTNGKDFSVILNQSELRKHLGYYKGTMAYLALNNEFKKTAVKTGEGIASVEFVATASEYRGKGIASAIMNHLFSLPQYNEYVLEAADTNSNAVRLYKKLGYREFKRIRQKFSKISGVNYLIYMSYKKSE